MVSYNPRKPADSALTEAAINDLLKLRAPLSEQQQYAVTLGKELPAWMRPWLWPFIALSAVGFAVSLWVHLEALDRKTVLPQAFFFPLHACIFVVWIPAVLVSIKRVGNTRRKDFWKAALRGSPSWVRFLLYGIMVYGTAAFILSMLYHPAPGSEGGSTGAEWRSFSAIWLEFYAAAFAILYSAATNEKSSLGPPPQIQP